MSVEEIFRFSCDAPGCPEKKEVVAEEADHADVPEGWYEEQVGDTHLIGCSKTHICAAIVRELGYEEVAQAMMTLQVPERPAPAKTPAPVRMAAESPGTLADTKPPDPSPPKEDTPLSIKRDGEG
jgi:hypothetical protein